MYSILVVFLTNILLNTLPNSYASKVLSEKNIIPGSHRHDISFAKRGLPFHDPSVFIQNFNGEGSKVSWAYNWYSTTDNIFPSYLEYVPMLWGDSPEHTLNWAFDVQTSLTRGTTRHLLSFNEPDACSDGGSCITPEVAAAVYMEHFQPFTTSFRLGAPAVTNSPRGLAWLGKFMELCAECTMDFVPIHWYDNASNSAYLFSFMDQVHDLVETRNIWITEFRASGTLEEQRQFLAEVIPKMDALPWLERYAWFWCDPSQPSGSLVESNASLTLLGQEYAYGF